jgi:prepilin-type N-terminal cleavage/methylation domain-containing protein
MRLRYAFTLVELLVVIAIIGLLSMVAITSLNSSKTQARNAKRVGDIRQLVTAFNLGLGSSANGSYPGTGGDVWRCISTACTGIWSALPADAGVDAFLAPYTPKPADPGDGDSRTGSGYLYNGASVVGGGYPSIYYLLELPATCNLGKFVSSTSNYVKCIVRLE